MLYTIVPYEEIFSGEYEPKLVEVVRGQMRLQVAPDGRGTARIVRVISSDPNDFLRPAYQPGEMIQIYPWDPVEPEEEADLT